MNEWLFDAVIGYAMFSLGLTAIAYGLLPIVARHLLSRLVAVVGEGLRRTARQRREQLLERGCTSVLSGPQAAVIGTLVAPHLERLAGKIFHEMEALQGESAQPVMDSMLQECRARRWTISLVLAQGVMLLVAGGFLLRGWCHYD